MWTRRQWLQHLLMGTAALATNRAAAIGDLSHFAIAQLRYDGGNWKPRDFATNKLLLEVEKRTSILVNHQTAEVSAEDHQQLFRYPFLLWTGDQAFPPLSDTAINNLAIFLRSGGFILVDSCEGIRNGSFHQSLSRELKRILPKNPLQTLSWDHVLYKSFYLLLNQPWGCNDTQRQLEAIPQDDRLMLVYSQNDLQGAWARDHFGNYLHDVFPDGDRQREYSYRYGINLVMYALCINYKADQVHIPFILRRRQWQID